MCSSDLAEAREVGALVVDCVIHFAAWIEWHLPGRWHFRREFLDGGRGSHHLAIDHDLEPGTAAIAFAGLVPENRHVVAPVGDLVQREVVPRRRNERIDGELVLVFHDEPAQPGDDEIDKARVEIVLAAVVEVVVVPLAGVGMEGLGDVGRSVLALGEGVDAEELVVVGTGDVVLDRKSTRLNSSHVVISYAVFCLKKKSMRSSA